MDRLRPRLHLRRVVAACLQHYEGQESRDGRRGEEEIRHEAARRRQSRNKENSLRQLQ